MYRYRYSVPDDFRRGDGCSSSVMIKDQGKTVPTMSKKGRSRQQQSAIARDLPVDVDEPQQQILSTVRVLLLGVMLVATGALGFYNLPGMIKIDADGSRLVNSIYCSVMTLTTIGFGDICPGDLAPISKLFLVLFALSGLGFFCGPLLEVSSSSWTKHVPGGLATLATLTVGIGVAIFSNIEGVSQSEAFYASIIAGTTIGYGDLTPKSDVGKLAVAVYVVMVVNVVAGLLQPGRIYLEDLCRVPKHLVSAKPLSATITASKKSVVKED